MEWLDTKHNAGLHLANHDILVGLGSEGPVNIQRVDPNVCREPNDDGT